jgi:hypothetical protein
MVRNRPLLPIAGLMTLFFASYVVARGQVWDFLGCAQLDARLDHGKVEISRRDCLFRTIQLRITGDAIFFDHVLLHFDNGTDQNVAIGRRISSEEREYVINLPGEGRVLESVEFFYFKELWQHIPRVSFYGLRSPDQLGDRRRANTIHTMDVSDGKDQAKHSSSSVWSLVGV